MRVTRRLARYELMNVLRSKWPIAYGLFFMLAAEVLLRFAGDSARALISLMNVVLLVVPLFSLLFGTMYLYAAREFGRLVLAQPVSRSQLYGGLYLGLSLPLAAAAPIGIGLPFLIHGLSDSAHLPALLMLLATSLLLALVFVGLAFLVAVLIRDRAAGLGASIVLWLLLAALYDGLVLLLAGVLYQYPLDRPMLVLMFLNPIDLARVMFLLEFDVAALMGYTGAVFRRFFGTGLGLGLAFAALLSWLIVPLALGLRAFSRRDL